MTARAGAAVRVLDIRDQGPDLSFLDKLDKSTAHRQGLADRVVVIDSTDTLLDNHSRFQRLVSLTHVRAVICVAVGPLAREGQIALRQSAALGTAGVTLWVGDEWGSRWAGGTDRPHPITADGPQSLPDLIAALDNPQVFDEVFDVVRTIPHQAVCPGLSVVYPTVAAGELRFLRTAALDELMEHSRSATPWPPAPAPTRWRDPVDPRRDLITAESPVGRSRRELRGVLAAVGSAAAALPGFGALLTGEPRVDPARIATAAEEHLDRVEELLVQLDRQSTGQGGADRLSRLGVPAVDPSDNPALSENLRTLVRTGLRTGHSLRDLATHLRRVSNQSVPEGSAAARAEVAALRQNLLAGMRTPEPPEVWPLPASVLGGGAAPSTLLTTWITGSVLPGLLVGLVWVVLVALFLARLPGRSTTAWSPRNRLLLAGTVPVVAIALGVGAALPPAGGATPAGLVVTLVALAVALGGTGLAWRYTVSGWLRGLRLAEAGRTLAHIESTVDDRVRDYVRTFEHRRRLSDSALLLASGITELARLYAERVARDRERDPAAHGAAAAELLEVLRGDLISLTMRALDNYLNAIGTDAPLATDPARLAAEANRDLTDYHAFLDAHSIHAQPPMVEDSAARESLTLALWRRSDAGRRVLRSDGRDELVQLCEAGDIRALNVSWTDVRVVRFAPALVQRVLLGTADVDVVTTDTDMIGVLRLMPLAAGRVVYEHPVVTTNSEDPEGRYA